MTAAEAAAARWDQGPRPFYEVWYLIAVAPSSGDGLWIRYTLLNPLDDRAGAGATLWFGYTCRAEPTRSFAITSDFPRGRFRAPQGALDLRFGDLPDANTGQLAPRPGGAMGGASAALLHDGQMRGAIAPSAATGGHGAVWDLSFAGDAATGQLDGEARPGADREAHRLMPAWLRRFSDRRTALTIPYPRLHATGEVTVDGRRLDLDRAPGHLAHHWGRERAEAWDWAHCAHFDEDPDAVVEALAPLLAGGRLRLTFVNLHLRDRILRCERPAEVLRNRSSSGLGWWRFAAHEGRTRVEVELTVAPDLLLPFTYLSPSYQPSRCWNTQIADCQVRLFEDGREIRALRSHGKASAEMHRSRCDQIPYESWAHGRAAALVLR